MMTRRRWQQSLAAAGLLAIGAHTSAPSSATEPASTSARSTDRDERASGQRLREGSKLHHAEGRFEFAGDRISFQITATKESFRVLENLALERISKVLGEDREPQVWIISGTVTEYRGSNYLLITKSILKTL